MKKFLLLFAGAAFMLGSCSDSDNAGNEGGNGSDEVRNVFVKNTDIAGLPSNFSVDEVIFYVDYNNGNSTHDLVETKWQNGFTFRLPETVSSTYLSSISSILHISGEDADKDDVKISNTAAMITGYSGVELLNDDETVGYVYVSGNNDNWEIIYMYADRDVNVKGDRENEEYRDKYDLELKKGWNRVAWIRYISTNNGETYEYYEIKTGLPGHLDWKYRTEKVFDPIN